MQCKKMPPFHPMNLPRCLTVAAVLLPFAVGSASAAVYNYTDWTAANPGAGTASGTITLPDLSTVSVGFSAVYPNGAAGSFNFAQTSGGGTNYWSPSAPYISAQVENAPPGTDILSLVGGQNQIYTITLSEAIKDPIMAIVSLGQPNWTTKYQFDRPFTIVSQGTGYWGGGPNSLQQDPGNVLVGNEGHGTIQFIGTFSTFSWTVPVGENWHGFTFGIRTTERIEPSPVPDAGATLPLLGVALVAMGLMARRARRRA